MSKIKLTILQIQLQMLIATTLLLVSGLFLKSGRWATNRAKLHRELADRMLNELP